MRSFVSAASHWALGSTLLLVACDEESETTWDQYNGDTDHVSIDVGLDTRYVAEGDAAADCTAGLTFDEAEGPRPPPAADTGGADTGGADTGGADTGDSGDSGDTGGADTGDSGDTGDTGDSGDTGGDELVPEVSAVVLSSNTGAVSVGWGCVSPSAGPIGTVHQVKVRVAPDYKDAVERVSIRTASGDRGEDEYDLEKDATGEGYWVTELQSQGEPGEVRSDTFTFRLWQAVSSETEE